MSTKLDSNQVLKNVYDEPANRLRTDASVSVVLGTVEVIINHVNDSIKIGDGTDLALVTASGELNVLASAQPGVDIGDVTVNNAAGASAVNIQDGGNSITVDASNLDIRDLVFATDKVDVSGSEVSLDATSLAALENITVTVSNEVEIKNDSGSPVPISGTVTANAGTNLNTSALNLETTQSTFSGKFSPASAAITTVARSATTQVILASNSSRKGFLLHNDTAAICYVAFAATATTALFTLRVAANSLYESPIPCYTGVISGIWSGGGANNLIVTELT